MTRNRRVTRRRKRKVRERKGGEDIKGRRWEEEEKRYRMKGEEEKGEQGIKEWEKRSIG